MCVLGVFLNPHLCECVCGRSEGLILCVWGGGGGGSERGVCVCVQQEWGVCSKLGGSYGWSPGAVKGRGGRPVGWAAATLTDRAWVGRVSYVDHTPDLSNPCVVGECCGQAPDWELPLPC